MIEPIYTLDDLEQFLNDLTKTKEGKKIVDDLEYWTPKYIGNGLYQIGNVITGKRGLEELDKALIRKVKEYEIKSN
jgi:hypothetical protein